MQILVSLKFGDGNFQTGFSQNINILDIVNTEGKSTKIEIKLGSAPEIPVLYQKWQNKYTSLLNPVRMGFKRKQTTNFSWSESYQECEESAKNLQIQLNAWLASVKSKLELELATVSDHKPETITEIIFIIDTQQVKSQSDKDILHRLPWREWDYFPGNSSLEAALCLHESQVKIQPIENKVFRRVRITSIFGDNANIDIETDRELIEKLKQRGAELTVLSQPKRPDFIKLWDEPCDILFYSGHSQTDSNSQVGSFQINQSDSLNPEEIENTFREAIAKGLKLAIFNSCDGLGLAQQFANLGLPYIIVWREAVPDKIAQNFLKYFLNSFARGKSLFASVRDARVKLQELSNKEDVEQQIPGVNWLPIICQNTPEAAPNWEDLGGLTGKLPDSPYKGLSAFKEEDAAIFFGRDRFITDLVDLANNKPLVPVVGASGSGKSSLVFAGLVPQLRANGNVQIVSFRPGKNPFDALAVALNSHLQSLHLQSLNLSNGESIKGNNQRLKELELEVELLNNEQALCKLVGNLITPSKVSPELNKDILQPRSSKFDLSSNEPQIKNNNISGVFNEKNLHQNFVLIIDQFEELYTLVAEQQRQLFLDALLYAVKFAPSFTLVLTLRADFMGKALDYQPMGEALQKYSPVLLTSMNPEELAQTIEKPAEKMKVELEEGLTAKLIDDLGKQPGRLPLLEFTLTQLWQKPNKWYLTHQAYREIGGLEKALAKYADSVLDLLSVSEKQQAERIFIQLVRPGEATEDTKRKATRREIGEDNWDLVEFLANKRLVVTDWDETTQQQTVEIIHEALIREWGKLQRWIEVNRRFRIWQERLQFAVVKWETEKHDRDYLLSGGVLGEAVIWFTDERYSQYLSDSQREFIQESLQAQDREEQKKNRQQQEKVRLQKRAIAWLSGGLLAASLATGFAGWNWGKAEISATQEKLNRSVAISKHSFDLQNYGDALLEAMKAKQLLERNWWGKFVKTDIKQKVKMAIYKPINHYWIDEKYILIGHKYKINSVVFSYDHKTIASASKDRKIKIWSVENGTLIHTLSGHTSEVNSVVFSNKNTIIASASKDGKIKLWSSEDGKLLHTLSGHKSEVNNVVFSGDGNIITSASKDGTVKIWSVENGKLLHTLSGHKSEVNNVVFSSNKNIIASASKDGTVKIWSVQNGKLIRTLSGHKSEVNNVVFSPDGKNIVSASEDGTLKFWSTRDGKLLQTLSRHQSGVNSVRFSLDGKTIASASKDGTVKIWSASDYNLLHSLSGHEDSVIRVEFSPNGKTVASVSKNETVKLWSVLDGKSLYSFSGLNVVFSSDSKTIASTSKNHKIKILSVQEGKLFQSLEGHKDWVRSAIFSPNGKTIVSASKDGTVKIWSASNGKLLYTLLGHKDEVYNAVFSPNGKIVASASKDGTVKLWSTKNGKLLHTLSGHKKAVLSVQFSPNGKTIASASQDGTVKIWSVEDGKLLHTLSGHKSEVNNVVFSPNGKTIASASKDETVNIWSTIDGKLLHTLLGHEVWVYSLEFSPDGKTIASASADKKIKLWSVENGKLIHTLPGHKDVVLSVKFSPDGKNIASASADKKIKLWSVEGRKLIHTFTGHKNLVSSVTFSPDNKTIASTSQDKTVKLWSTISGQLLHTLSGHKSDVNTAIFSPDGKIIASASDDGTVKLWNWNLDDLLARGCKKLKNYLIKRPEQLEKLEVCQNREILTIAASSLVKEGENLAKDRNFESSVEKFRQAKNWNPKLDIAPRKKAKAIILIAQGRELAKNGQIKQAIAIYDKAIKTDSKLQVSAGNWNNLCWYGSLYDYPKEVMFACDRAVALAPEDLDIIDSRGLARALTGDYKGAIEDFEVFVKWKYDSEYKLERQAWIKDLQNGKNPFTSKVMQDLRSR